MSCPPETTLLWYLGETKPVRYRVTSSDGSTFTITSASAVVYGPDHASVASGTALILRPGTADQELQFAFTPTVAGLHKAIFTVVTSTGVTREFPVDLYVRAVP